MEARRHVVAAQHILDSSGFDISNGVNTTAARRAFIHSSRAALATGVSLPRLASLLKMPPTALFMLLDDQP